MKLLCIISYFLAVRMMSQMWKKIQEKLKTRSALENGVWFVMLIISIYCCYVRKIGPPSSGLFFSFFIKIANLATINNASSCTFSFQQLYVKFDFDKSVQYLKLNIKKKLQMSNKKFSVFLNGEMTNKSKYLAL